jgi:AmiR/NasT family two-component response regulator
MLVPYSSNNQIVTLTQQSTAKPPSVAPQKRLNLMAQKTIDAIKNKREEKAVKQQLEEEKKRINKEKSVMRAKEVLDRRRVQLGIIKGSNE